VARGLLPGDLGFVRGGWGSPAALDSRGTGGVLGFGGSSAGLGVQDGFWLLRVGREGLGREGAGLTGLISCMFT
jgi:hypothetical protein